jgi:hypothetical protein
MMKPLNRRRGAVGVIARIVTTLITLVLCFLALFALTACRGSRSEPEAPAETLNFKEDIPLPLGKPVLAVQRADTDSDKKLEWVLYYRFDQVGTGGPVAALIYDVVNDPATQLPIVYPYKLRTPDQDYLAEEVPVLTRYDVLRESTGTPRNELVFATTHEVSIFRLTRDPDVFAADNSPLYRCIGFFRSDEVAFDPKTFEVTVTSNAGFERSQLVTRRYYDAANSDQVEGYFVTTTTSLAAPKESKVDFSEGRIPDAVLDTPYPEKIVLAFYQTLGQASPGIDILYYLSSAAADAYKQGKLKYGSPFALDQLDRAIVTELSYIATQDTDTVAHATAWVVFYTKSKQKSNPIEVHWRLVRVDNRWKMDYSGL